MKHQHTKRIWNDPFYVNKKHFCPACRERLHKIEVSRIVNSNSPEAKDFNFYSGESFMIGAVKFIWTEFKCFNCGEQITIEEMKRMDKGLTQEEMQLIRKRRKALSVILFIIVLIGFIVLTQVFKTVTGGR